MNSLHGIKISNDEAAIKGRTLTFRKRTGQLVLDGQALTPTFTTRRRATEWASKHGATVSPV